MSTKTFTQPEKEKEVSITQMSAFLVNGTGGISVIGLGSDGRPYFWDYKRGAWLQNWESPQERKAREAAEKAQEKLQSIRSPRKRRK